MSMIEKVARGILNAHAGDIPVHDADLQWSWWVDEARAAIEAMEPTADMALAAASRSLDAPGAPIDTEQAKACFRAMIQAALEGEG